MMRITTKVVKLLNKKQNIDLLKEACHQPAKWEKTRSRKKKFEWQVIEYINKYSTNAKY